MYVSLSTFAVLITAASAPLVSAGVVSERATSLCNQKYYGASGTPWNSNSAPGSFCGKSKPSNSGQWKNLPYWDGGDTVKCSTSSKKGLKVCNGGNPTTSLPSSCNPPHNFPSGWGGLKGGSGSIVITCKPATCNWNTWWNCLVPSAWRQTCTITTKPTGGSSSSSSSSKAPASSAAASSAAASSAAASSAAASSAPASSAAASLSAAASSSAASSAGSSDPAASSSAAASSAASSDAAASSAAPTQDPASSSAAASSTTSSAAAAATTTATVDPTQYPVCQSNYQVTYQNYTIVAPNGYWYGQTVGAALQDASYMTYTLATSVSDCLAACDQIEGCVFVNTYYDENDTETDLPKHTPGVLTCAMFSACVGTENNNNFGGQDDPNIIVNSNGYCKSSACTSS